MYHKRRTSTIILKSRLHQCHLLWGDSLNKHQQEHVAYDTNYAKKNHQLIWREPNILTLVTDNG